MDEQGKDLEQEQPTQEQPMQNQVIPLTEQDNLDILAVPAVYANKSFVSISQNMAKLTFAEYDMGKNSIRCALVMNIQDAINLANTIGFMVQKFQEDMAKDMQAMQVIRNRANGVN